MYGSLYHKNRTPTKNQLISILYVSTKILNKRFKSTIHSLRMKFPSSNYWTINKRQAKILFNGERKIHEWNKKWGMDGKTKRGV